MEWSLTIVAPRSASRANHPIWSDAPGAARLLRSSRDRAAGYGNPARTRERTGGADAPETAEPHRDRSTRARPSRARRVPRRASVIPLVLAFRGLARALGATWRDPETKALPVVAGVLVLTGTLFYWRFEDWTIVEAFYFCIVTLDDSRLRRPHPDERRNAALHGRLHPHRAWHPRRPARLGRGALRRPEGRPRQASRTAPGPSRQGTSGGGAARAAVGTRGARQEPSSPIRASLTKRARPPRPRRTRRCRGRCTRRAQRRTATTRGCCRRSRAARRPRRDCRR